MALNRIPDQPGFLIRRLQQVAVSLFHRALDPTDITPVQYTILMVLAHNEGLTQNNIAELTYLDTSTTADVLRRLEARNYVCRRVNAEDRRSKLVDITDAGMELLDSVRDRIKSSVDYLFEPLSEEEIALFMTTISRMLAFHEPHSDKA